MARHKELLSIYYNFRNIDFNQDLIDELKIDKVYRIDKKQVQDERYIPNAGRYIRQCLGLIIEENKNNLQKVRMKIASSEKRHNRNNSMAKAGMANIKSRLKSRNQRSKK